MDTRDPKKTKIKILVPPGAEVLRVWIDENEVDRESVDVVEAQLVPDAMFCPACRKPVFRHEFAALGCKCGAKG